VLEPPLLLGGRDAGQEVEPSVDLKRVGRDRHRVLAALAEALGELHGHGCLAHPGGAEDGYDGFGRGHDR
jgi:hypothetical protein